MCAVIYRLHINQERLFRTPPPPFSLPENVWSTVYIVEILFFIILLSSIVFNHMYFFHACSRIAFSINVMFVKRHLYLHELVPSLLHLTWHPSICLHICIYRKTCVIKKWWFSAWAFNDASSVVRTEGSEWAGTDRWGASTSGTHVENKKWTRISADLQTAYAFMCFRLFGFKYILLLFLIVSQFFYGSSVLMWMGGCMMPFHTQKIVHMYGYHLKPSVCSFWNVHNLLERTHKHFGNDGEH